MGKRYFCDYCDRSFQDNLHNRKKHLSGLQHLKAKKVWYDMFRDAAAILLDEQNKRPCRKFLLTGHCDFGSNCRFSHMSEQDLQELSIQVEEERRAREWPVETAELSEVHLEDWLEKRAKRLSSAPSISAYRPRFHTGCIAFSAVDVHICVISPHRWTLRVLHLAQDHSCGPVSAYSPHLGLSSEERFLALRVHVIQALLPDGPCRWTPFPAAVVVGEQCGSARCCTLTLCLSPIQG
nr:zinc finger matrin-type protein 5 isoform X1 [Meriones unguiculatus]XP_021488421.1 zinc finger matrin-type protein 5 isoform X1 [Meriones unguiculatus]